MKLAIEIDMAGAAFHDPMDCACDDGDTENCEQARATEAKQIIDDALWGMDATMYIDDGEMTAIIDSNGNTVGKAEVTA